MHNNEFKSHRLSNISDTIETNFETVMKDVENRLKNSIDDRFKLKIVKLLIQLPFLINVVDYHQNVLI